MNEDPTLKGIAKQLQKIIEDVEVLGGEGGPERSRELSLVRTDLQSAQNWLVRILAPGFVESITE